MNYIPDNFSDMWIEVCQDQKDPPPIYCQIPEELSKFRDSLSIKIVTTTTVSGTSGTSTTTTL